MICEFLSSGKCCVNIPWLNWKFVYNILHVAGPSSSCSLVLYMKVVSIVLYAHNPVTSSPFRSHMPGCLSLKNTLSPTLKPGGMWFVVFCACLNPFSSKVFLAMASARQCDLRSKYPDSGSPRNCCIGLSNWWRGKLGSLPQTRKKGVSVVARCGVTW